MHRRSVKTRNLGISYDVQMDEEDNTRIGLKEINNIKLCQGELVLPLLY